MATGLIPGIDVLSGIIPVDLQTGANTGLRIKMDDADTAAIVFYAGKGKAGDDPTLTVLQHDAASAGNSKALAIRKVYTKQGASGGAMPSEWTVVEPTTANTYTHADAAENEVLWVVEFKAEDLDRANGYYWLSANVADIGTNAQLGAMLYLKGGLRLAKD